SFFRVDWYGKSEAALGSISRRCDGSASPCHLLFITEPSTTMTTVSDQEDYRYQQAAAPIAISDLFITAHRQCCLRGGDPLVQWPVLRRWRRRDREEEIRGRRTMSVRVGVKNE
ncbi:Hypothetical predicted protein, partial [Olea europaea subsp. europaea]